MPATAVARQGRERTSNNSATLGTLSHGKRRTLYRITESDASRAPDPTIVAPAARCCALRLLSSLPTQPPSAARTFRRSSGASRRIGELSLQQRVSRARCADSTTGSGPRCADEIRGRRSADRSTIPGAHRSEREASRMVEKATDDAGDGDCLSHPGTPAMRVQMPRTMRSISTRLRGVIEARINSRSASRFTLIRMRARRTSRAWRASGGCARACYDAGHAAQRGTRKATVPRASDRR